jgi:lysophospholipase L1-like esterase
VRSGYSKYFPGETKTDTNEKGERLAYQINSHGFRAPDFETAKAPGVSARRRPRGVVNVRLRIQRQRDLSEPAAGSPQRTLAKSQQKYEVINLGIPHLTSQMIHDLFIAEGVPLQPDVVTFYEGYNDSATTPGVLSVESIRNTSHTEGHIAKVYRTLVPVYRWARDWSMSLLFIDNMVQTSQRSTPAQVAAYRSAQRTSGFLANLQAIRDATEKAGGKFVAVSQQAKSFIVPRESIHGVTFADERRRIEAKLADEGTLTLQELFFLGHSDTMDALRKWARAEQVPFVDGIQRLDNEREELYTWVHLTPRGNALLADAIADEILRQTCK